MKCPHDDCGLDKPDLSGYESKHTPTPWTFGHNTKTGFDTETLVYTDDERAGFVAAVQETAQGKANAAFIVHAVNSHEAMLSALKNLRANVEELPAIIHRGGCMVGDKECVESMRVWIDDAIAQAEKGAI